MSHATWVDGVNSLVWLLQSAASWAFFGFGGGWDRGTFSSLPHTHTHHPQTQWKWLKMHPVWRLTIGWLVIRWRCTNHHTPSAIWHVTRQQQYHILKRNHRYNLHYCVLRSIENASPCLYAVACVPSHIRYDVWGVSWFTTLTPPLPEAGIEHDSVSYDVIMVLLHLLCVTWIYVRQEPRINEIIPTYWLQSHPLIFVSLQKSHSRL